MATVNEMIAYAKTKTKEMRAKMLEIDVLLHDFLNPGQARRSWIDITVDTQGAHDEYLSLLADAEAIMVEFPKTPDDVPEPSP